MESVLALEVGAAASSSLSRAIWEQHEQHHEQHHEQQHEQHHEQQHEHSWNRTTITTRPFFSMLIKTWIRRNNRHSFIHQFIVFRCMGVASIQRDRWWMQSPWIRYLKDLYRSGHGYPMGVKYHKKLHYTDTSGPAAQLDWKAWPKILSIYIFYMNSIQKNNGKINHNNQSCKNASSKSQWI